MFERIQKSIPMGSGRGIAPTEIGSERDVVRKNEQIQYELRKSSSVCGGSPCPSSVRAIGGFADRCAILRRLFSIGGCFVAWYGRVHDGVVFPQPRSRPTSSAIDFDHLLDHLFGADPHVACAICHLRLRFCGAPSNSHVFRWSQCRVQTGRCRQSTDRDIGCRSSVGDERLL